MGPSRGAGAVIAVFVQVAPSGLLALSVAPQNMNSLPVQTPWVEIEVSPVGVTDQVSPPSVERHALPALSTTSRMSLAERMSPPLVPVPPAAHSGGKVGRHQLSPPSELMSM